MWGRGFSTFIVAAALLTAWPAKSQTPDDHADEWTEARRGDRDWTQRATEQLTAGLTEHTMGRPPKGPLIDAVKHIRSHIEGLQPRVRTPCLAAALDLAHYQSVTTDRQEAMVGAFEMLTSALQGASGARGMAEFLGKKLAEQVGETLRDRALDKFKEEMREAMKKGTPDYWSDWDRRGPCKTEYRGVWDKAAERYYFIMAGDCECNEVDCGQHVPGKVRLRRWTLEGWGTIVPEIDQAANGEKRIRYAVGRPQDVSLTVECCGRGDERTYTTYPANGAGNAWVGFVRPPATTPTPTPQRRPQTGGDTSGAAGTSGTPAPQGTTPAPPPAVRPRPARIEVPVVPDRPMTEAELEALGEQVSATYQRAQFANEEAVRRLDELEEKGASAQDIREAEGDVEATEEIRRRTRAALDQVLEKFNEQQSSAPPDRASAQALALHNQVRANVGVPPLRWDRELAASADAYAEHLANGVPYVHAGRIGREDQRENLSMGYRGAGAVAMMQKWISEKRNFKPGLFPDVSLTGNWEDAGHYSQMIWPTTTRVGCGTASGAQWEYLVCRYSPPGNRDGSRVP